MDYEWLGAIPYPRVNIQILLKRTPTQLICSYYSLKQIGAYKDNI